MKDAPQHGEKGPIEQRTNRGTYHYCPRQPRLSDGNEPSVSCSRGKDRESNSPVRSNRGMEAEPAGMMGRNPGRRKSGLGL